jgi:bacillithiol synthase
LKSLEAKLPIVPISNIPFSSLPGFSPSWIAVTQGRDAGDLFARPPANTPACRDAAKQALARERPWRELAQVLETSGRHYGVPENVLARLTAVAEGRAVMVVTGQQVGYLGGPLYTFLKAYHSVRLAAVLEHELAIPVLPVFWLEGEDHDLAEVRDAHFPEQSGELHTLRFTPAREIANVEVGRYAVDAGEHLRELARMLDSTSADGLEILRRAYTNATLSDGLGHLLAAALGARGLFVIEGSNPALKQMAVPLWERVIQAGPALGEMLAERSTELRAGGWGAPLSPTADSYLFYVAGEDHVRVPLTYAGKLQHSDGRTETFLPHELLARVREQPVVVSPKAALRPLYQDFVLPTVVYVAGPGEMDYHAQIKPFYAALDVIPPSVFPRLSATIIEARTQHALDKLGLPLEKVLTSEKHDLVRELLGQVDDGHTAELFAAAHHDIEQVFARVKDYVARIDPTLEGAAQSGIGKALHPLEQLREKTERALKQKHSTLLARLDKVLNAVRPENKLSERMFCGGYYLAKYGPEKLLAALDELPAEANKHVVIVLE